HARAGQVGRAAAGGPVVGRQVADRRRPPAGEGVRGDGEVVVPVRLVFAQGGDHGGEVDDARQRRQGGGQRVGLVGAGGALAGAVGAGPGRDRAVVGEER